MSLAFEGVSAGDVTGSLVKIQHKPKLTQSTGLGVHCRADRLMLTSNARIGYAEAATKST